MTRPRDSQQSKVFAADQALRSTEQQLNDAEVQIFLDSVTGSRWYGNRLEEIRGRRLDQSERRLTAAFYGHGFARCTTGQSVGEVTLGDAQVNRIEILHQVTHYLLPNTVAWHGVEYARLFVEMVGRYAPDRADEVRAEFKARKIKWRTRNMSPEAKAAASERMKARHRDKVAAESTGLVADLEALLRDLES